MLQEPVALFIFAVFLAYVYAFVGGFTDAANAIATSVGSRVLSPRAAVVMAGSFNLLGGLMGTAVAVTIGRGLVDPHVLSLLTVVSGVAGAMTWSLITYRSGIPVSETHGLLAGLVGAAIATAGIDVVQWEGLTKVFVAIFASPLLGFVGGFVLITIAALGTAYGGWRIIQTLGMRMTDLDPVQGFAAEVAGASVIQVASELGIPVSTTHAITSAILGVGVTRALSAVRWGVTFEIFFSWVLTVPVAMGLGALYLVLLRGLLTAF